MAVSVLSERDSPLDSSVSGKLQSGFLQLILGSPGWYVTTIGILLLSVRCRGVNTFRLDLDLAFRICSFTTPSRYPLVTKYLVISLVHPFSIKKYFFPCNGILSRLPPFAVLWFSEIVEYVHLYTWKCRVNPHLREVNGLRYVSKALTWSEEEIKHFIWVRIHMDQFCSSVTCLTCIWIFEQIHLQDTRVAVAFCPLECLYCFTPNTNEKFNG